MLVQLITLLAHTTETYRLETRFYGRRLMGHGDTTRGLFISQSNPTARSAGSYPASTGSTPVSATKAACRWTRASHQWFFGFHAPITDTTCRCILLVRRFLQAWFDSMPSANIQSHQVAHPLDGEQRNTQNYGCPISNKTPLF